MVFELFFYCVTVQPKNCQNIVEHFVKSHIEVILLKVNTERAQRND